MSADTTARADVSLALDDAIAAAAKLQCLLSAARAMHEVGCAPTETRKLLIRVASVNHEIIELAAITAARL